MSAPDAQGVPRPPGDGHAVGQVVAAGSAGGSIYDLGYRGYTGPRLGRRHAVASLIRQSFRQAWGVGRGGRAKVVPIVLGGIATVPAVVALGFLALARQLGGVNVEGVSPIRYETYYPLIAQVVFLFAAAQAPELLGRDLRHRVLALYFSRAIERDDYALGKLVALAGAMLVLILFPQTLVLLGRTLLSADLVQGLLDQLPSVPAIVGQAVLTAGFLGALGLAIACWTPAALVRDRRDLRGRHRAAHRRRGHRRPERTGPRRLRVVAQPGRRARGIERVLLRRERRRPGRGVDAERRVRRRGHRPHRALRGRARLALPAARTVSAPPRGPAWGQPATDPSRPPARGADVVLPAEAPILLDAVSRWYGNVVAVNDVSFAVGPGITGLLGPNGAGKSTILRHDRRTPRAVDGPRHPARRAGAGAIPTSTAGSGSCPSARRCRGYLTGRAFVGYTARLHGLPDPEQAAARAPSSSSSSTDAAARPTGTYSKGMRQRIKLAAALVHEPPVLLLDEPFNGIDPRQRLHLMALLRRLAAAGRTILFSSHILEEVERLAGRVLVRVRRPARRLGRLPRDPPAHDRPAALVHDPFDRRPPAGGGAARGRRRWSAWSWSTGGCPSAPPTTRLFGRLLPRSRARRGSDPARGPPDRRVARERLRLPGAAMSALRAPAGRGATGDWSTITSIALVTLRALLARRRAALMLLLAGVPVLVGLLARVRGLPDDSATRTVDALEALIVATLLPITALVFGTSALGAELEDGSAIHLLTKPVARWRIVLAKLLAAAPVTAGLVAASTLITGLLLARPMAGWR